MRDLESTTVEEAARLAADDVYEDGPSRAELALEGPVRGSAVPDPYRGRCGGCGRPVGADQPGGSCLWRGGPWHPACRRADRAQARLGAS